LFALDEGVIIESGSFYYPFCAPGFFKGNMGILSLVPSSSEATSLDVFAFAIAVESLEVHDGGLGPPINYDCNILCFNKVL